MSMEIPGNQTEGHVARSIEKQTAKLPSDLFLWAGLGSMALSLAMRAFGKKEAANFVAPWVPTVLLLGVYNKIVKVAGHDRNTNKAAGGRSGSPPQRPVPERFTREPPRVDRPGK